MTMFIVCVPFYSLPQFPKSCLVVTRQDIILRDILLCNKTNSIHIEGGMQYDPRIENLEYKYCQPRVRLALMNRKNEYDELYILFRTRYLRLNGSSRYYVVGYYNMLKEDFEYFERDAPVIYAKKARFVSLPDAVDMTKQMVVSRAFRACPTTENEKWEPLLREWLKQLQEKQDNTHLYIQEMERLKKIFKNNEFTGKFYSICRNCVCKDWGGLVCPLVWRKNAYAPLPDFPEHYIPGSSKHK